MRWTGKPGPVVKIPVYGSEPGLQLDVPEGLLGAASTKPEVIARLKAHGITVETISQGAGGERRHDPPL